MTETRKDSFQHQAEQNIDAAALQMARRIQTPGQSKQQTKLIAQGIAKGIALYKKQQSEKARDRERARKKMLKQHIRAPSGAQDEAPAMHDERVPGGVTAALWTGGTLFGVVSVCHLWRFFTGLPIVLGTWPIPVFWSLPVSALSFGLAIWFFLAGRRRSSQRSSRDPVKSNA